MATRGIVPRANGEGSIGTEKKRWGAAFFDKIAVKTLEVLGAGTEDDNQPATIGWVKQSLQSIFTDLLTKTGFTANFATNGYVAFGRMFGGLKVQWGQITVQVNNPHPSEENIRRITLPIACDTTNYYVTCWDCNPQNTVLRCYKANSATKDAFDFRALSLVNGEVKETQNFAAAFFVIGR